MNLDQSQKRGIISYTFDTGEKIGLIRILFPLNRLPIESFTINVDSFSGRGHLEITVQNPSSRDHAYQEASKVMPMILDKIAYFYDIKIGKPQTVYYRLEITHADGSTEEKPTEEIIGQNHQISRYYSYHAPDPKLIDFLNLPSDPYQELYLRQYRIALQSDDVVAQYMLLYGILLQIFHDCQSKVDRFVRKIEPDVPIFENKFKKNRKIITKQESIYTKLRNELAHVQQNRTFEETIEAVEQNLEKLRALTKQALEQQTL